MAKKAMALPMPVAMPAKRVNPKAIQKEPDSMTEEFTGFEGGRRGGDKGTGLGFGGVSGIVGG